jgi:hypothetical protein
VGWLVDAVQRIFDPLYKSEVDQTPPQPMGLCDLLL